MEEAQISFRTYNDTDSTVDSLDFICVKLRRLKIEEGALSNSIIKNFKDYQRDSEDCIQNHSISMESKKYYTKIKNSFVEIRNLFEDIKANTSSKDNLKVLDVDEIKKDVLELDDKIRKFKIFLQSESTSLKVEEQQLNMEVNGDWFNKDKMKKPKKIQNKPYNEIVPSPVRVIINSPSKCPEIQQLQEFMMNSTNRYGGWNAYNHNIFELSWQKHFSPYKMGGELNYEEIANSSKFKFFVQDIFLKIPGIQAEDIISHGKWYSKYMYLKGRQQRALDRWRANKKAIKNVHRLILPKHANADRTKSELYYIPCEKKNAELSEESLSTIVSDESKENDTLFSDENNSDCFEKLIDSNHLLHDGRVFITHQIHKKITTNKSCKLLNVAIGKKDLGNPPKQENNNTVNNKSVLSLGFLKPTAQWNNRHNSAREPLKRNVYFDDIGKLRNPDWRLALQE